MWEITRMKEILTEGTDASMSDVVTINPSRIFHSSLRYEPLSRINPNEISFKNISIAKNPVVT